MLKFGVFVVFLASIAAAFWWELRPVWRGFGMSLPELAGVALRLSVILLAYLVVMRLATRYRLIARREEGPR